MAALWAAIRDWTSAQILGGATDNDQLICDGKTLCASIVPTAGGGSAYSLRPTTSIFPMCRSIALLSVWRSDSFERTLPVFFTCLIVATHPLSSGIVAVTIAVEGPV